MRLKKNQLDIINLILIVILAFFFIFDFNSSSFSWMDFHERDYTRALKFYYGLGLDFVGPEMTRGSFIPGPFLTFFNYFALLLGDTPRSVHFLNQLIYVLAIIPFFYFVKSLFSREAGYISIFLYLTSIPILGYSFAGWHACLILPFNTFLMWFFYKTLQEKNIVLIFIFGILVGVFSQIHIIFLEYSMAYLIAFIYFFKGKRKLVSSAFVFGCLLTYAFFLFGEFKNNFETLNLTQLYSKKNTYYEVFKYRLLNDFNFLGTIKQYFSTGMYNQFLPETFYDELKKVPFLSRGYFNTDLVRVVFLLLSVVLSLSFITFYLLKKIKLMVFWEMKKLRVLVILTLSYFFVAPLYSFDNSPRFFQIIHPWFEMLLGVSIVYVVNIYQNKKYRFLLYAFWGCVGAYNVYSFKANLNNADYVKQFYQLYTPFYNQEKVVDVLINKLQLSVDEYENKFYFIHYDHIWRFGQKFNLPSVLSYRFRYKESNTKKILDIDLEKEKAGVLMYEKKYESLANLNGLQIIKKIFIDEFVIVYYRGPYFYHQVQDYISLNSFEVLAGKDIFKNGITKADNGLTLANKIKLDVNSFVVKKIEGLVFLDIKKNNTTKQLEGFLSLESKDLRQSMFDTSSPCFVMSPRLVINSKWNKEILTDNFYSNAVNMSSEGFEELYGVFGHPSQKKILGNYYIETPFGMNFSLPFHLISDIKRIDVCVKGIGCKLSDNILSAKTFYKDNNSQCVLIYAE